MKIEIIYPDENEQEPIEVTPTLIEYANNFMDLYLGFKKKTGN